MLALHDRRLLASKRVRSVTCYGVLKAAEAFKHAGHGRLRLLLQRRRVYLTSARREGRGRLRFRRVGHYPRIHLNPFTVVIPYSLFCFLGSGKSGIRDGASCCGPSRAPDGPCDPRAPVQSRWGPELGVPSRSQGLPWVVSTIHPNAGPWPCRKGGHWSAAGGLSSTDERVRGHVTKVIQALCKSSKWSPRHPHV
jgi:hypothetical protein